MTFSKPTQNENHNQTKNSPALHRIYVFIKSVPALAPHYIVQQLKGYSSKVLRNEFSNLKSRLPTLWTRSYYCESIGHISEETVKKYIEDQKNK